MVDVDGKQIIKGPIRAGKGDASLLQAGEENFDLAFISMSSFG
jgi:hypothetical protein